MSLHKIVHSNFTGMILAAGQGKRMANDRPKVLHTVLGKPMIARCMGALRGASINHIIVVLSKGQKSLEDYLVQTGSTLGAGCTLAYQDSPKGTAHAVQAGLAGFPTLHQSPLGHLVVAYGDTPLVTSETYAGAMAFHLQAQNDFTILAFNTTQPQGYGRVMVSEAGEFLKICEEKDCTPEERLVTLVNSGILIGRNQEFFKYLPMVKNSNSANEFYLTDVSLLAKHDGLRVGVFSGADSVEFFGVNSQEQLASVSSIFQRRIILNWMSKGVQFLNPDQVYIDDLVTFEPGVIVEPFVSLSGSQHFVSGTRIPAGTGFSFMKG